MEQYLISKERMYSDGILRSRTIENMEIALTLLMRCTMEVVIMNTFTVFAKSEHGVFAIKREV